MSVAVVNGTPPRPQQAQAPRKSEIYKFVEEENTSEPFYFQIQLKQTSLLGRLVL